MVQKVPAAMTTEALAADTTVQTTGNQTIAGVKTFSSQPSMPQWPVLVASKASTSGTTVDFTDIPSWATRITVMLNGVGTNGTSPLRLRIGDAGGFETADYVNLASTTGVGNTAGTAGFDLHDQSATANVIGRFELMKFSGNTWLCTGQFGLDSGVNPKFCSGSKTLSDVLDRIRLTTVNGTDAFDTGSVSIRYE